MLELFSAIHSEFLASRSQLKCDGTRTETRFILSAKRTSPFKLAGTSVQSTTGSRGVRISGSNAVYTMFRGSVKGTGCPHHSPVSPLHFPTRASPCAIAFQLESTCTAGRQTLCSFASSKTDITLCVGTNHQNMHNMEQISYRLLRLVYHLTCCDLYNILYTPRADVA